MRNRLAPFLALAIILSVGLATKCHGDARGESKSYVRILN